MKGERVFLILIWLTVKINKKQVYISNVSVVAESLDVLILLFCYSLCVSFSENIIFYI